MNYPEIRRPDGYPLVMSALRQAPSLAQNHPKEDEEHARLVQHIDLACDLPKWGISAPNWLHPPMGEFRHKVTARRLHKMGARSGPSDFLFLRGFDLDGRRFSGLVIELKRRQPAPWKLADTQRAFVEHARDAGFIAEVCHGWVESKALFDLCYLAR